ncbi:MAG: T9SS type A sorting domain-containing protein [Bacteroidales bacterium]|nr:T9SS type A sorting domain-containing protein [Bacteroidales bacterium]
MKFNILKKTVLITLLTLTVLQSNSQVVPDSTYYKRLFYLCKVWGHAKYYHTEIANGNVNWDYELLAVINEIKNAATNNAFNDTLQKMLNNAGEMGTSSNTIPDVPDSLNNNTDYTWIQNSIFSDSVRAILDTIKNRFRPQSNVYVDEAWAGGNPTFDMDNLYYSETYYPTEKMRLLALFRYWNIINYFFPYKYIMDQNWDTTLVEFIPKIIEASNAISYHLAFKKLTTKINDSHAFFYSSTYSGWLGSSDPPFLVRFIENEMVITKVLPEITEVNVGDVIKEIDGENIYNLRDSLRKYANGSNDVIIERELNYIITKGGYGSFSITVDNGTNIHTESLNRNYSNYTSLNTNTGPIWKDTTINGNCNFGIVDMGRLKKEDISTMFSDLWNTDAIIFDIRNYPNGTLWDIVNYLYPTSINIANFTTPDITYPGRLYWNYEHIGTGTAEPYSGKLIILFDERTQSQAEYTCMGLEQFPNAIKIGSTTAAADGNVAIIYLPGSISTYATFLGTYYPDYTQTQRVGIIPDFEVHPTISGMRSSRDEVMDFALNCSLINIKKISINEEIKLYPNPVKNEMRYELKSNNNNTILFEIIDVSGRIIKTIEKNTHQGVINFSNNKKGFYIIKITTNKRVLTKKIIKN